MPPISRRKLLVTIPAIPLLGRERTQPATGEVDATFPSHSPAIAREIVSVAHGNVARVRELLRGRPALANAAWDWGFGDWETALGAASHMGNREIAALLVAAGAHPTLFSAAMLGEIDVVKAFLAASPGVQRIRGPHGLTLMAHARAGGPASQRVVEYLESISGADQRYINEPLSEADRAALPGTYAFGAQPQQQLVVALGEQAVSMKREGGVERRLFHLGDRVFHPAGAEAVRIRFDGGAPAATVTVHDGDVVVMAARRG